MNYKISLDQKLFLYNHSAIHLIYNSLQLLSRMKMNCHKMFQRLRTRSVLKISIGSQLSCTHILLCSIAIRIERFPLAAGELTRRKRICLKVNLWQTPWSTIILYWYSTENNDGIYWDIGKNFSIIFCLEFYDRPASPLFQFIAAICRDVKLISPKGSFEMRKLHYSGKGDWILVNNKKKKVFDMFKF